MSASQQMVDIYWTVQRGRRYTISLSEEAAWDSLEDYWAYDEDPNGWTVERTYELVPTAIAEVSEGGGGEIVTFDEEGKSSPPVPYVPVRLFWTCPLCGQAHSNGLYNDPVGRTNAESSPALWFCELGKGVVLVRWSLTS